jgi:hypothetical protein
MFLRNFGSSYYSQSASYPRRQHYSNWTVIRLIAVQCLNIFFTSPSQNRLKLEECFLLRFDAVWLLEELTFRRKLSSPLKG